MSGPSRRQALAGGALVVAFSLSPRAFAQESEAKKAGPVLPGNLAKFPMLESWIRVDEHGHVTVFTGKAELGQGLKTALIQVAADELGVAPAAIELVTADTARTPDEGVTAGSHSMQDSGKAILNAAANVRALLSEAAATRWGLAIEEVGARDGGVHAQDGRTLSYGELASRLSLHVEAKSDIPRRGDTGMRVIGTNLARVDIPAKVTGGVAYVQDLRLPGMLHARVVRGPSEGTRLKQIDIDAVTALPGIVQVVRKGRFTAVVAEREWTAITALRRLQSGGWERPGPSLPANHVHEALRRLPAQDVPIFHYPGPPAPAEAKTVKARYSRPYLMHGSIGPSCAVALWENDSVTVWTHSQGVYPLRQSLADLLHLPKDKVRCIHVEGSGCYGHNGADDVAADATLAARAVPGRPVRLQWMREQEHGWEPLGPAMTVELEAALGADGRVASWHHEVWSNEHNARPTSGGNLLAGAEMDPPFPPQIPKPIPMPEGGAARNGNPLYALPNADGVFHFITQTPVRVSALRGLGAHMNVFSIESFMDELASAANADPVGFRLAHMEDVRAREVIELAADRFGWKKRATGGSGRGCGFAFARYKNLGAYCAVAMEIDVAVDSGKINVHRVVAAVDSGEAVNPDGIRNQIEGGIVQSLSWTVHEAVLLDAAHRSSFDWSAYPILRFEDAPGALEVHVIDRPRQPFLGTGEAGQGPAAAALANAVADAVRLRLRDMPLSPERVRANFDS